MTRRSSRLAAVSPDSPKPSIASTTEEETGWKTKNYELDNFFRV